MRLEMTNKKLTLLLIVAISMIGLNGCSRTIKQQFEPILKPSIVTAPPKPYTAREQHFSSSLAACVIDRDVFYKVALTTKRTDRKLNKRWYQLWN